MQKKLASIIFSTRLTATLFIVFAIAMAVGTLVDASSETSPTPYSRALIYNAWWFEAIMGLFVVNFLGNIVRFKMFSKEKATTLVIHLSFILILVGAFVTRYIGYEGVMQINEGDTSNEILSEFAYLNVFIDGDYVIDGQQQRLKLAPKKMDLSQRLSNHFSMSKTYNQTPVTITYKDFIKGATKGMIEDPVGEGYLKIVEAGDGTRHDHYVKVGEVSNIHNILFAVNKPTKGAINIFYDEQSQEYQIQSSFAGEYMRMADQQKGIVIKDSLQNLQLRSLYQMAAMAFVIPDPVVNGRMGIIKATKDAPAVTNALILNVSSGGQTKTLELLGGRGSTPSPVKVAINGLEVYATYGSKTIELPFSITLNDFIAEKYPGTEKSYKSFKSKVTVNSADGTFQEEEIFMNNVLDKEGFRFFQSGFQPDEKGTILAVNHDKWGTWITYIGYFLLYFGLMAILFDRNSRFGNLKKYLEKIKKKKKLLACLAMLFMSTVAISQTDNHQHVTTINTQIDSLINANAVSKEHAAAFARLVIQDNGRMKPISTFASELIRKVSGSDSYNGLDANQVFMSVTQFPRLWSQVPIIKLKRGNDSIRDIVGVPKGTKTIALIDLFDKDVNFKLDPYLEAATSTNTPNQFQKDFIKAYESYYIFNQALGGSILKIFPVPEDPGNKWVSYPELNQSAIKGQDSMFTKTALPLYFNSLSAAKASNDYTKPAEILSLIRAYQKKHGSEVLPSDSKISAEIAYNKINIFNRLFRYFTLFGV
ncbi:MAG: cytochrome c biogenesis protein ResB, partial [Patiriisocius sp.]